MEINLKNSRQLAMRITSAYITKVQGEEGDGLCELATTPSYGFCLEMLLSSDGTWSFDDASIDFVETAGSNSEPNASDLRFGIAGYMPATTLVRPCDPAKKIDALVELWGVSLPPKYDDLGDHDLWRHFERFKTLIADNRDVQGRVQAALLDRVDENFVNELHESVHKWLSRGCQTLADSLLDG